MVSPRIQTALEAALQAASPYIGATSPNPPVGAAALDAEGRILSAQGHPRAGEGHAEARVIADLSARGLIRQIASMVVTLEPCNHQGRTPPCTEALLALPSLKRVVIGVKDPNPKVIGGGAQALARAGIDVEWAEGEPRERCLELIAPFTKLVRTGLPWIVIKTAHQPDGSMIPPPGQKTFTSPDSLRLAHELRRQSDAILTGSGTILADRPEFTVRHVPDHPGKKRWLVILDRKGRVSQEYLTSIESQGFMPRIETDLGGALDFLGSQGVLQVLVEAGPTLTEALLREGIWDRHVVITRGFGDEPDQVETRSNPSHVHGHH